MERIDELWQSIGRHCTCGRIQTPVPRLALLRSDVVNAPVQAIYDPMLCIVVQGRKR